MFESGGTLGILFNRNTFGHLTIKETWLRVSICKSRTYRNSLISAKSSPRLIINLQNNINKSSDSLKYIAFIVKDTSL